MSEHAHDAPAGLAATVSREPARAVRSPGHDWPLAALFFAIVLASYAAVAGAIYLAVTTLI